MVVSGLVLSVYILNTCIGGLSNIAFVYKVWNTKSKRNPLLIGMIVFDLSVCTISCPVKTLKRIFKPHLKTLTGVIFLEFLEELPVSCATLSMMCVAVDRYCVAKKYQSLKQYTREQILPFILGLVVVLSSLIILLETFS
ncbi:hypothetical protein HUJ04_012577 [Dendroctonus ponderosae]|nr:hypothetical protein HUJ04_012577 [Dendroctonus ponderosae]KAH1023356.1 hypothetical protein HUJ04_012577 [Dendroctonus ponderosae]KAH1023357.1 hypothetical protein HUJ04_012577 [Dendroctonus ponderosae]KAH1023358.1 hypothetical protein HUJ04_012577 [Dendroctonus ponderosae]KAH1029800.1 hypothetical protein HUJ05_002968 [Dendroctonus ponderosae]